MARISNLNKAFERIEKRASSFTDPLTQFVYEEFLKDAVSEFNLNEEKAQELRIMMKFSLPVVHLPDSETKKIIVEDSAEFTDISKGIVTYEPIPTDIESLLERISVLELAVAKFATLAGYGNYLSEFGLERWVPGKKDMKKFG